MAKYKAKTTVNEKSVDAFLGEVEPETKRDDCYAIVKMMSDLTKEPAKMWGPAIVGFGFIHYEYESGHSGDMPVLAFSPRKKNIVLYLGDVLDDAAQLKKLGRVKTTKGCLYIDKLGTLDTSVMKDLLKKSIARTKKEFKIK